ncbi:MAG: aldehyde dehydrogenase family protein [Planctomycetia bacterium]|nr:aldehyde dehydrogenase family protein [Planctomycetia bacterium]
MSVLELQHSPSSTDEIERSLADLDAAKTKLSEMDLQGRINLLEDCLERVVQLAPEWVDAACKAKGVSAKSPMRAEEIAAGPVATARHLRLLLQSYRAVRTTGKIKLPAAAIQGPDGSLRVQVMPVQGLFDAIVFAGFKAHAWLAPEVSRQDLEQLGRQLKNWGPAKTALVLGAGNVSSIPVTDTLSKVFQEGKVVLLKMNPVNEYLGPIFARLFTKLIDSGFARIIYGGADIGAAAIGHPQVDEVHITGSIHSHDAIVWGSPGPERERRKREQAPILDKPITSELGSVSPWIVVPGPYSARQLRFQAENVAASITNNASFNCIATKVIITWKQWPQRQQFIEMVEQFLANVPPRRAYYPGALERYCRFAGQRPVASDSLTLPWTLVRDADPKGSPQLFGEESFVCVCAEIGLEAVDEKEFLAQAVEFSNEKLWGTLSAALTVHPSFRRAAEGEAYFQSCLANLRYGAVGVNHWPALIYAMMSPPWGGYPSGTLADAQSGIGSVHNTFMLSGVQKTVLEGPLTISPKPFWFPTNRRPEPVAWKLLDLYGKPSVWKLSGLLWAALGG